MLKKRNGFSFANGETHDTSTTSKTVSSNNHSGLKNIFRYNTTPTRTLTKQETETTTDTETTEPEDILADCNLFRQEPTPVWKRKRFHFIIGLSVGLLAAAYGASTTPTAQTHLNELQTYLQDMDLSRMIPSVVGEGVDEIFGNLTNYFTTPNTRPSSSDQSFMPALTLK